MLILVVHIPSLIGIITQTPNYYSPSRVLAFVYIILVGDLIKCYENELMVKYFKYVSLFFIFSLFLIVYRSVFYQPYLFDKLPKFPEWFLIGAESINALLFSFTFFILIKKLNIKKVNLVLFLSPVMLDTYLIHDNFYIRPLIWDIIFDNKSYFYSSLITRTFLEPFIVFSICILLAMMRMKIFRGLNKATSIATSIFSKIFG